MKLTPPKTGSDLVDMYFDDMRSHLLEVAAAFDRVERAGGEGDPRLQQLREAARIATGDGPDRAERFLEFLSV